MKLLWLKEIIGDAYTEDMDAAACQAIRSCRRRTGWRGKSLTCC